MTADQEYGAEENRPQETGHPEAVTTAKVDNGARPTESVNTASVAPSTSEAESRNDAWPDKDHASRPEADLEPHPGIPWTSLATSAVLALIFGGLGAWGFERFLAKPTPPPEPPTAKAPEKPTPPRPADDKQLNALSKKVDDLNSQVSRIRDQILVESKNQPRHQIKALTNRVEALESQIEPNSGPNVKIDELNTHITTLDKSIETLRDEVLALRDGVGSAPSTSTTQRTTARPPAVNDADGSDLGEGFSTGVEQFHKARYAEALRAFRQAQTDHPDDARVWYYSALAEGFSSRDWTGKAAELVKRGIEQERKGSPSPETIDNAFDALTSATGKDWLAGYRKRAR